MRSQTITTRSRMTPMPRSVDDMLTHIRAMDRVAALEDEVLQLKRSLERANKDLVAMANALEVKTSRARRWENKAYLLETERNKMAKQVRNTRNKFWLLLEAYETMCAEVRRLKGDDDAQS